MNLSSFQNFTRPLFKRVMEIDSHQRNNMVNIYFLSRLVHNHSCSESFYTTVCPFSHYFLKILNILQQPNYRKCTFLNFC